MFPMLVAVEEEEYLMLVVGEVEDHQVVAETYLMLVEVEGMEVVVEV